MPGFILLYLLALLSYASSKSESLADNDNALFDSWMADSISTNRSTSAPLNAFSSLLGDPLSTNSTNLMSRQDSECTLGPGGPICSPETCCAAGQRCCDVAGCCDSSAQCIGDIGCCPSNGKICSDDTTCCPTDGNCCEGSPTGCCKAGGVCCQSAGCCPPDSKCCGDACCSEDEFCEQAGVCLSKDLKDRVVRLDADNEEIFELLKNMCNGMRGKNVETLTYSGPARGKEGKQEKNKKRRAAGCVDGYCRGQINAGLIPSHFDSCDEYPPASSDEGGGTRDRIETAVNCIPSAQNTFQGNQIKNAVKGLSKGDKFAVSIDCDKVLGSIGPPLLARADISTNGTQKNITHVLNDTAGYIIIPFGDLESGTYTGSVKVENGETIEAYIIDSDGDEYTDNSLPGLSKNNTQQFSFDLGEESVGMGIVLVTKNNKTKVSWKFEGTLTSSSTPANGGPDSAPPGQGGNGESAILIDTICLAVGVSLAAVMSFIA